VRYSTVASDKCLRIVADDNVEVVRSSLNAFRYALDVNGQKIMLNPPWTKERVESLQRAIGAFLRER
jgi:predicted RNA methylase